jgi:SIR2-like domain
MAHNRSDEWFFPDDGPTLDALVRLAQHLRTGDACMLAGAGVAVQSGFPTWSEVLNELAKELGTKESPEVLSLLANLKDNLWRAEEYRSKLTDSSYYGFLRRRFEPRGQPSPGALLNIVRLNCKHIFTTNYDVSLEHAHQAAFSREPSELDWNNRDAVRVFLSKLGDPTNSRHYAHIHGRFDKPEGIVFTYRDYVKRYIENDEMVQKLFVLLATQSFLFIGFSLEDPDFVQILRQVNSRLGKGENPAHFAILPMLNSEELPIERRRLRGKYDIDPIFYRVRAGDDVDVFWDAKFLRRVPRDLL